MRDKHSPQKILVTITLAVVLLMGSAIGVIAWRLHDSTKTQETKTSSQQTAKREETKKPATVEPVNYSGEEGKTALELLKTHATVITKDSSYGPYVDSINGVAGGTDGKYWAFYVNGSLAQVGADAYTTTSTDTIEWKFE